MQFVQETFYVDEDIEIFKVNDGSSVYSLDQGLSYNQKTFRDGKIYVDKIIPWGEDLRVEEVFDGWHSLYRKGPKFHNDTAKTELYSIISPAGTTEYNSALSKYKFLDTEFGWDSEQLLARNNPSQNWEPVIEIDGLKSMFFANNLLWAIGDDYYFSSDLGANWNSISSPILGEVKDLFFQNDFLFVGIQNENFEDGLQLFRSDLINNDWVEISSTLDCDYIYKLIKAKDEILAYCNWNIYSSVDNGKNWELLKEINGLVSSEEYPTYFANDDDYFLDQFFGNCRISNQQFTDAKSLAMPTKSIAGDGWNTWVTEGARTFLFHNDYLYAGGQGLWRISKEAIDKGLEPTTNTFEICEGDQLILNGNSYSSAGEHVYYNQLNELESFTLVVNKSYQINKIKHVDYGTVINNQALFSDTTLTTLYSTINGCDSLVSIFYNVDEFVGISNLYQSDSFSLFPNPTKDIINIQGDGKIESICILDLNGKIIERRNLARSLSLAHLNTGVFLVQIVYDNGVEVHRVARM